MGPNAAVTEAAILGILSLIIWALILIVTVKYVIILLRADNNGEGGTLALMALANRTLGGKSALIVVLGMISAALFYGDAMITPALSVLSAVEGLEVVAPALEHYVRAAVGRDPVRAVLGAVARHGAGGDLLRADHRWSGSSLLAAAGVWSHRAQSERARRLQSACTA